MATAFPKKAGRKERGVRPRSQRTKSLIAAALRVWESKPENRGMNVSAWRRQNEA